MGRLQQQLWACNHGVLRDLLNESPIKPKKEDTVDLSFSLAEDNELEIKKTSCLVKERDIVMQTASLKRIYMMLVVFPVPLFYCIFFLETMNPRTDT